MEAGSSGWNDYVREKKIIKESSLKYFLQNLKEHKITFVQYQCRLHSQKGLLLFITLTLGKILGVLCSSALESGKICFFTWVSCETQ